MQLDNDVQDPTQKDAHSNMTREKCCAKCRYFEVRTGFCRFNPPTPIVTYDKDNHPLVTSVYSKINMPALDWCQKFEQNEAAK